MSTHLGGTSRLTYSLNTVPAPLATGQPVHLDIVASNSGVEPVLCKQILVVIPTGGLAQDLLPAGGHIVATAEPADQWTIDEIENGVILTLPRDETAAFTPDGREGTPVTVRPAAGESVSLTTHGLLLHLKDFEANDVTGTALLRIRETVSVDNGVTWETNQITVPLAKYPPTGALATDTVGDLVLRETDDNGNPGSTPVTMLRTGQKAVLTWNAPADAVCDVYYGGKHEGPLSGQDKWRFPVAGLTRDTQFQIGVTLRRGGEMITRYLSTTVVVEEHTVPNLIVEKITPGGARKNGHGNPLLTIAGAVEVEKEAHVFGTLYGGNRLLVVGDQLEARKGIGTTKLEYIHTSTADATTTIE